MDNDFDPPTTEEDAELVRAYQQDIRNTNARDSGRYDCPDCGAVGALSAYEKKRGYHCAKCTRITEQGW